MISPLAGPTVSTIGLANKREENANPEYKTPLPTPPKLSPYISKV